MRLRRKGNGHSRSYFSENSRDANRRKWVLPSNEMAPTEEDGKGNWKSLGFRGGKILALSNFGGTEEPRKNIFKENGKKNGGDSGPWAGRARRITVKKRFSSKKKSQ